MHVLQVILEEKSSCKLLVGDNESAESNGIATFDWHGNGWYGG